MFRLNYNCDVQLKEFPNVQILLLVKVLLSTSLCVKLNVILSAKSVLPVSQPPPVRPPCMCAGQLNCLPSIMDTAECKYAANVVADGDLSRPCPTVCAGSSEQTADSVSGRGCGTCFCP